MNAQEPCCGHTATSDCICCLDVLLSMLERVLWSCYLTSAESMRCVHELRWSHGLQVSTEGITQTIRAMVLSAVVQDGHATEGLEVGTQSGTLRCLASSIARGRCRGNCCALRCSLCSVSNEAIIARL